jgi:hypothetical protein
MQTEGGAFAEEAILSSERQFYIEVKVDWNRNGLFDHQLSDLSGYIDTVSTDRSLRGSAPEEVMLIEGSSAAELEISLGGVLDNGMNLTGVFSPYNGTSPLYGLDPVGCEITYRLGIDTSVGISWYSQFVGNIRLISPNRGSNSITITALDRAEVLRVPVKFPKWAISSWHVDRGWAEAQLCDSQWVIDHCLRHGDTSPSRFRWKYDREFGQHDDPWWNYLDVGMQLFITGNGSIVPSVGQLDNSRSQGYPKSETTGAPMYSQTADVHPGSDPGRRTRGFNGVTDDATGETADGPWSANENRYWARDRKNFGTTGTQFFGFTLNRVSDPDVSYNPSYPGTVTPTYYPMDIYIGRMHMLRIGINTGSIRAEIRQRETMGGAVTPWYAIPIVDNCQFTIICHVVSDVVELAVYANGTLLSAGLVNTGWNIQTHWGDGPDPYAFPTDYIQGLVVVRRKASISDIFWNSRYYSIGSLESEFTQGQFMPEAKYPAVLDNGLNKLTATPVGQYEDAWQVITDVAAAELGSAMWDEHGVFRFWNRDTVLAKQEDIVRTLNLDDVTGLQITNSLDSVRNVVTADTKAVTATGSAVAYAASSVDELYVPANSTVELTVYRDDIYQVDPWKVPRFATVTDSNVPDLWDPDGDSDGYVVQFLIAGVWQEANHFTSGVDITARLDADGNMVVVIFNGYANPARFGTGTGDNQAALRVLGTLITSAPNVVVTKMDTPSVNRYGPRNLAVSGDWVQWQPQSAQSLLDYLLPRSINPIPTTDAITIPGDPRLQLGDTMLIQDPDGMGEEMKVQIYGIRRSYSSEQGLVDTLTVEMLRPPLIGYWDSAQYGLWDQSFYWSA